MLTPHQRTRLIPVDATSSPDLVVAANHLLTAEWSEQAVEGELLSQDPEDGYGANLTIDTLMPELLRQRLHRAILEVSFYTEVQVRRDRCECNQCC